MFEKTRPYNDLPKLSSIKNIENKKLLKACIEATAELSTLNRALKTLINPNIILDTLALQEAKVSSEIENIVTTNDDIYRRIAFDEKTPAAKEVVDYKDALFLGVGELRSKDLISAADINEINMLINTGKKGYRKNLAEGSNHTQIGTTVNGKMEEVLYTPPHGLDIINDLIKDLLGFMYYSDKYEIDNLIKIAMAHYQFEAIHPFYDGNGRTGRILNILFLMYYKYIDYPVLYLSGYIVRNKTEYYDLLMGVTKEGDWHKFIDYMLNGIIETSKKTVTLIDNITKCYDNWSEKLVNKEIKIAKEFADSKKVLEMTFEKVYITISDLTNTSEEFAGFSRESASNYLKKLVKYGLLEQEESKEDKRKKIYKNIELLKIIEKD